MVIAALKEPCLKPHLICFLEIVWLLLCSMEAVHAHFRSLEIDRTVQLAHSQA